jgi:hypothetical protein
MKSTRQAAELIRLSLNEFRTGNFVDALAYVETALEINPKDVRALQIRPLCKCCLIVESGAIPPNLQTDIQNIISDLKVSIETLDDMIRVARTNT